MHGLAFEFLADQPQASGPVLTGHLDGVITINLAEADDAEREQRRLQLHEPYRTLLGHFRHEVGHYYWERLIAGSDRLEPFRGLFGDERADYGAALQAHYQSGAPGDWQSRFVTTYATAHPWEDWAETWAHYLHMTDTLETAAACGVSMRPRRRDEPALPPRAGSGRLAGRRIRSADGQLVPADLRAEQPQSRPRPARRATRSCCRPPAIEKLRFVHDVIAAVGASAAPAAPSNRAAAAGAGRPPSPPDPPARRT